MCVCVESSQVACCSTLIRAQNLHTHVNWQVSFVPDDDDEGKESLITNVTREILIIIIIEKLTIHLLIKRNSFSRIPSSHRGRCHTRNNDNHSPRFTQVILQSLPYERLSEEYGAGCVCVSHKSAYKGNAFALACKPIRVIQSIFSPL